MMAKNRVKNLIEPCDPGISMSKKCSLDAESVDWSITSFVLYKSHIEKAFESTGVRDRPHGRYTELRSQRSHRNKLHVHNV